MTLTMERLRELFSYDPETGDFIRRITTSSNAKTGDRAGSLTDRGYRRIQIGARGYGAHRLAWFWMTGAWPPDDIDHINGNRADNRWTNLRKATRSQNMANSRIYSNNTSGFKGVRWHRQEKRWYAQIYDNGRNRRLGVFDTPEEAHAAYKRAAEELFGEFAKHLSEKRLTRFGRRADCWQVVAR